MRRGKRIFAQATAVFATAVMLTSAGYAEQYVFQNGLDKYHGVRDCFISLSKPNSPRNMKDFVAVRSVRKEGEYRNALLKFGNLSALSGMKVKSAEIAVFVSKVSGFRKITTQSIKIFAMKKEWTENATWMKPDRAKEVKWDIPGAKAPGERGAEIATIPLKRIKAGTWLRIKIPAELAQAWIDGTRGDYGILISGVNANDGNDVALTFIPQNNTDKSKTPKLTVETE